VLCRSRLKNSVRLPASFNEDRAIDRAAIDRAAWTSMKTSTRLPTGKFDEDRAIDLVATILIPMLLHQLTPEFSREWLKTTLQQKLREGLLDLTTLAVKAADAGDEITDAALRTVYAEMAGGALPRRGPGHLQIWAYGQRAILRAPHKRPQGHRWHDYWMRNIQICVLIVTVCRELGVHATRHRDHHSKSGATRAPSGISIAVEAFARSGTHLHEASVQENLWFGLAGEVVRSVTHFSDSTSSLP
jgi:hypothetical protein